MLLSAETVDSYTIRNELYRDYKALTMTTRSTRKTDSTTEVDVPEMVTILFRMSKL